MKIQKNNSIRGFTLIELLVVVAIVGLLSSVVFTSLNTARAKARDAHRKEDIRQIQTALELYYDANGQYPPSGGATSPNASWTSSGNASWTTLETALKPYLPTLSKDPRDNGVFPNFTYSYYSLNFGCNQQWYVLVYTLENADGPDLGVYTCDGTFFQYGGGASKTTIKTVGAKSR